MEDVRFFHHVLPARRSARHSWNFQTAAGLVRCANGELYQNESPSAPETQKAGPHRQRALMGLARWSRATQ